MSVKCVMVVSPPASGGSLIAKTLMVMGFKAPGIPSDPTSDWNLVAINHLVCDRAQKPKISLEMAKHAAEPMTMYVDNKIKEGNNWIMHDSMLCMTFFVTRSLTVCTEPSEIVTSQEPAKHLPVPPGP